MADLIDQGNKFLKSGKFEDAKKKYIEAIQTNELEEKVFIRANNNLAVAYQLSGEFANSVKACCEVVRVDEFNFKARLRMSKLFFQSGKYKRACREIIKIDGNEERSERMKMIKKLEEKNIFAVDLSILVEILSKVLKGFVFSKQQLVSIEDGEYHTTWKLQDYFDSSTEEKYVPCPPRLFFKNNPDENENASINLYHQYTHGSMRSYGMLNIVFAAIMFKLFEKKILHFQKRRIIRFGLIRGRFVGKSIIFHSVNRNGVIRRDYDDHYWIFLQLDGEEEDLFLDFMAPIFDCFETYKDTGVPLRLFREKDLKNLVTKERIEVKKKLQRFFKIGYQQDVINGHIEEFFNKLLYNFEQELKVSSILKKDYHFD